MKKLSFAFILILIFLQKTNAQEFGLQLNAGLMNYAGDLQSKSYTFNNAQLTGGISVLYRIKKFALNAGFNYGHVAGDDKNSANYQRNLNFKSAIQEATLSLEYDIISPDKDSKFIPYLFAGGGIYHFNPFTYYNMQKVYLQPLGIEGEGLPDYPNRKMYSLTNIEVPAGLGLRYKLSDNLLIGIEFCSRFLNTDYLDDVSRSYPDENKLLNARGQLSVNLSYRGNELTPGSPFPSGRTRGNPQHNDNFYTSLLTLTYTFSQKNLFNSNGNTSGHNRHALDCPKRVH